jgi:hypothetical protein
MAQLNQIIAVEKGVKNQTKQELTQLYHKIQQAEGLSGFEKTYKPLNEESKEFLPPQSKRVTVKVTDVVELMKATVGKLFDVTFTKDVTNCVAKADVEVDGKALLKDVPVSYLLFLEKQLVDIRTFITKLPTLPLDEEWKWDENKLLFVTDPVQTISTKKQEEVVVKYPATQQHPAQTEIRVKDVTTGSWTTIKYSGALPANKQREFLKKVETLQEAVKISREKANMVAVTNTGKVSEAVFTFIFG